MIVVKEGAGQPDLGRTSSPGTGRQSALPVNPDREQGSAFSKEDQSVVTRKRAMVRGRADPSNSQLQLDVRRPQQREGTTGLGTLRVFM